MPPTEAASLWWDGSLALYLLGMLVEEADRILIGVRTLGRQAGMRKYFRDIFNLLEMGSLFGLAVLLGARQLNDNAKWAGIFWAEEVPSQAALALVSWLRVLQGLYVFPNSGVLLLMAIRMLSDLASFLALGTWIIFAFSCAFYVLSRQSLGAEEEGDAVSIWQILKYVLEGTLNAEPDRMVHSEIVFASNFLAEMLMVLYAVVVVLLLLNLLIASFNYTFDAMHQNVHANYRVAFARVVVDTCERRLLPPPLNLLRWLVEGVYATSGTAARCYFCMLGSARQSFEKLSDSDLSGEVGDTGGLGKRRGSLHSYTIDTQEWHVSTFLSKAAEKGVALLPECVEEYVSIHKHDIAPEERWRSVLLRDVSVVQESLAALSVEMRALREQQVQHHRGGERSSGKQGAIRASVRASLSTKNRAALPRQRTEINQEIIFSQGFSDTYAPPPSPVVTLRNDTQSPPQGWVDFDASAKVRPGTTVPAAQPAATQVQAAARVQAQTSEADASQTEATQLGHSMPNRPPGSPGTSASCLAARRLERGKERAERKGLP